MDFLKDVVDPRYSLGPLIVLPQNEAKYEKVSLGKASDDNVLPKNVDARGYHSSPLSVEPRVPPGPLNVDARGYHSSPLSTPSQHRAPEETGDHSTRSWLCERVLSRQEVGAAPLSPSMLTYTGTVARIMGLGRFKVKYMI